MITKINVSQFDTIYKGVVITDALGNVDLTGSTVYFLMVDAMNVVINTPILCTEGAILDGTEYAFDNGGVTIKFTESYLQNDGRFWGYFVRLFSTSTPTIVDEDYFGDYFSEGLGDEPVSENIQITYPSVGFIEIVVKKSYKLTEEI